MPTQYKIFLLPTTQNNIMYAKKQIYSLISPDYILIYTPNKRVRGGKRISGEMLNARDQSWVQQCNDAIIQSAIKRNPNIADSMMRFLDCFESELSQIQKSKGVTHVAESK